MNVKIPDSCFAFVSLSPTGGSAAIPDSYFALVRWRPLVCITSDNELRAALAAVDELLTQELDAGGEAYLDAISTLIHAYESKHHPIPAASPAEVLSELLAANEMTASALAEKTGIVLSTVSSLMRGNRRPTPEQAVALADVFNISPVAFLPKPEKPKAKEKAPPIPGG